MTDDIVARLRDCTCVSHGEICREAAAEIKRLRDLIEGYHLTAMGQRAEIKRLRELSGDAGCLRKERDEARWRLCKVVGDNRGVWGCEIAKENGWDYLAQEDKP